MMIDKVTCASEDIDTKSNKKKRAFFIKCLSGSAQRPGLCVRGDIQGTKAQPMF